MNWTEHTLKRRILGSTTVYRETESIVYVVDGTLGIQLYSRRGEGYSSGVRGGGSREVGRGEVLIFKKWLHWEGKFAQKMGKGVAG